MSVAARLSLFGAALVAVFALASVAGAALDAGSGVEEETTHEDGGMAMTTSTEDPEAGHTEMASAPAGLAIASGDHRDLHRVDRRQRQMCIRDRIR